MQKTVTDTTVVTPSYHTLNLYFGGWSTATIKGPAIPPRQIPGQPFPAIMAWCREEEIGALALYTASDLIPVTVTIQVLADRKDLDVSPVAELVFTGRLVVERDIDDQFVRIDAPTLGWVETGAEVPTGTYDVTVYVTGREKARLVEHEHYEREDSTLDELQAQSFEHFWIVLSEPPVS